MTASTAYLKGQMRPFLKQASLKFRRDGESSLLVMESLLEDTQILTEMRRKDVTYVSSTAERGDRNARERLSVIKPSKSRFFNFSISMEAAPLNPLSRATEVVETDGQNLIMR